MTKAQLVKSVSKTTGIDGKTTEYIIDSAIDVIKDAVVGGDSVSVRSFGTFCCQYRKAKVGRDINNNCSVEIPAHYVPKFKAAREFADAIASGTK